jgi:hypothetical protein
MTRQNTERASRSVYWPSKSCDVPIQMSYLSFHFSSLHGRGQAAKRKARLAQQLQGSPGVRDAGPGVHTALARPAGALRPTPCCCAGKRVASAGVGASAHLHALYTRCLMPRLYHFSR